jgi:hypothetical protein
LLAEVYKDADARDKPRHDAMDVHDR